MTTANRADAPPVRDHSGQRRWVGQSIRRVEDPKFLLGRGGYIADRITPGTLHVAVLRSPHPHARILGIETAQALAAPGVHAVITGQEAAELCNPMPDFGPDPARHAWRCLAADKVRYVGEGVAVVVADSRYLAEDALELIEVEYEPLPAVVDPERALAEGAPLVHEALESNCAYERTFDFGDVERDFAEADVVVRDRLRWHRSGGQPLETVGAIAEYDPGTGSFTIDTNTLSFTSYLFMAANTLKVPANKLDIRPVPAGGSFGSKLFANKPAVIAAMCSRATGRKVAYIEDRVDNISNCDHHGSDRVDEVELAMMRDGTMRSIKIDVIDDYGAYIQFGVGHHGNALAQVVGPYTIGSVRYQVRAALTNKNQQGAYRGFGSEVNNWMLEQMVELAARELGLDPVAVRRKNFIREFPYFIPTGNVYDSGDYDRVLDKALELADYDHWRAEQKRLREQGRYIGIGLISAQERSVFSATEFWFWFDEPGAPVTSTPESVSLKVDATGGITAILYSCAFWGNSPETMVSQFVAEEFDCSPYDVSVVYHGSRDGLPATGPGGSRTTVMLAGAVEGAAAKIKEKARRAAAHLLEIDPDDMEWSDGGFQVRGDPERKKSLGEIAVMLHLFKHSFPADMESGLDASKVYDHPYTTMPSADRKDLGVFYPFMGHACHVPVVEVDIETGAVTFLHYAAVHDCGTLVNPRSLAGHIVGGTAQGIGTALYEEYVYDEDGQLLSSSYLDYLIPSAMEVPELTIGHVETPSPYTPHGVKGGGEGGRMMAPAAINAAVNDALFPLGVRLTELPMTPERILSALRAAGPWVAAPDELTGGLGGPGRRGHRRQSGHRPCPHGGVRRGRLRGRRRSPRPGEPGGHGGGGRAGRRDGRPGRLRRTRRGLGRGPGRPGGADRPGARSGRQRRGGRTDSAPARDHAGGLAGNPRHRPRRRVPHLPGVHPGHDPAPGRQPDRDLVHDRQAPAARPHALRRGEDGRHRAGPDARHRTRVTQHPGQRGLPRLRRRAADGAGGPPAGRRPRDRRRAGAGRGDRPVAAGPHGATGGGGRGLRIPRVRRLGRDHRGGPQRHRRCRHVLIPGKETHADHRSVPGHLRRDEGIPQVT